MALIVKKFGGSSVGNIDKIKAVAKRILDEKYGENKWKKGANSEYSKIKKALDRGGLWPKSF